MAEAAAERRDPLGLRDDRADHASRPTPRTSTTAVLDGDEWVINGEKHYISGAGDPRCKIMITMVRTSPDAPPHKQQSQILVPTDTPG
jgi:acyl-CoA dehydrogenase